MDKKKERNILIIITAVTAVTVIILTLAGFAAKNTSYKQSEWVLRSYGNNVALYKNGEVDSVFGDIVLDTLPEEDIRLLENGIVFPTREEAIGAMEDYDG